MSFSRGADDHLGGINIKLQTDRGVAGDETEHFLAWLLDQGERPSALWIVAPGSPGTAPGSSVALRGSDSACQSALA